MPAAFVALIVVLASGRIAARVLAWAPILFLGEISYSIYAVHTWTLRAFLRPSVDFNLATGIEALIRIPVAMMFSIIMASATYRLIEAIW